MYKMNDFIPFTYTVLKGLSNTAVPDTVPLQCKWSTSQIAVVDGDIYIYIYIIGINLLTITTVKFNPVQFVSL